ncbi:SAM-dependent methyltransferase [Kitasatospora sp. NBC_01287]|uniref:SAM-dependent methyltransferase n=1 Tax=Kitasatospora sp. NBC_01287 TaxID=2903573 RepID=UPI00224FC212|nr:SAM-dependent methyltransferase [Kitasatospora sp. NBC_01287]MCX4744383.1 SAM-dependent methyltransferase [Kitasatospora sp. NBC_01287]
MTDYDGVNLELHRAHSARMYDYFLGGVTNFAADREAAGQVKAVMPFVQTTARVNRAFMHRATRALAEAGIDQFLDIGTGIPTSPNLHEIAQSVNRSARVVYADNDPIVLAHAKALLIGTPEGRTTYLQADVTDPAGLLASPELHSTLDFSRPIALSLNALLHFVPDDRGTAGIVEHFKGALVSGSALAMTHVTEDFAPTEIARLVQIYQAAGTPLQARSAAEFAAFFAGWELVAPGLVPTQRWRPQSVEGAAVSDEESSVYAGVALKP